MSDIEVTQSAHPWINFYQHNATDHRGRTLVDIWTMTFDELEKNHDFIQWLFPLPEPSPVNPDAPLLSEDVIAQVHQNENVQTNLLRSFDTMAAFWGFHRDDDNLLQRSSHFDHQSKKWCCPSDHNQLRITRVLKCLCLTGHAELAQNTCEFLLSEINHAGLSFSQVPSTAYWMDAIGTVEEVELTLEDFEPESANLN